MVGGRSRVHGCRGRWCSARFCARGAPCGGLRLFINGRRRVPRGRRARWGLHPGGRARHIVRIDRRQPGRGLLRLRHLGIAQAPDDWRGQLARRARREGCRRRRVDSIGSGWALRLATRSSGQQALLPVGFVRTTGNDEQALVVAAHGQPRQQARAQEAHAEHCRHHPHQARVSSDERLPTLVPGGAELDLRGAFRRLWACGGAGAVGQFIVVALAQVRIAQHLVGAVDHARSIRGQALHAHVGMGQPDQGAVAHPQGFRCQLLCRQAQHLVVGIARCKTGPLHEQHRCFAQLVRTRRQLIGQAADGPGGDGVQLGVQRTRFAQPYQVVSRCPRKVLQQIRQRGGGQR